MNINLTQEQEEFVKTKLRSGQYRNINELLATALKLLDEYDRSNAEWVKDIKIKIDAALAASESTPPVDGESFVKQILTEFQQK